MLELIKVLEKTDWKALREQKRALMRVGAEWSEALCRWIDEIQVAAEAAGYPVEWLTEGDGEDA
jgi:hypothetical protein